MYTEPADLLTSENSLLKLQPSGFESGMAFFVDISKHFAYT